MQSLLTVLPSAFFVFLFSYICGSCPTGYIIGRINGIDIRKYGSHNIGATNVRRVLGRDWSFLCFIVDFLKGFLPVVYIGHAMGSQMYVGAEMGGLLAVFGSICGHVFPVWLRFKGGKGVATSLGAVAGVAFIPVLIGSLSWYLVFYRGRMVSLASMVAVTVIALASIIMRLCGFAYSWLEILLLCVVALLVIVRHRENIGRILDGTESKFKKE